jgi:flagellar basal-body rod protein FlgB
LLSDGLLTPGHGLALLHRRSVSVLDDITSVAVRTALTGLAMRQRVTADNIANIETPGFLAGRVSFEDALRTAVDNGDAADATPSLARSLEPTRLGGNNVNLDHEVLTNVDTGLRYHLMLRAVDHKAGLISSVLRPGA